MSASQFQALVIQMLSASLVSMSIFFLTLIFSIPLGCVVTSLKLSRSKIISGITNIYIIIMRGTPLILQLLFFYFVPSFLFKHAINRFVSLIIAMSVNYAAYFAEIFRGGYLSIPSGLKEAAKILGFSKRQVLFNISRPITVKRVLPSFAGEVVTLVKDTALASVLGVAELFRVAQTSTSRMFSLTPLVMAGVFYFIFNALVSEFFRWTEKKLNYYNF